MIIIHVFGVVVVVALVLQIRFVHPSAEVAGFVGSALRGGEPSLDVGVVAHWVSTRE